MYDDSEKRNNNEPVYRYYDDDCYTYVKTYEEHNEPPKREEKKKSGGGFKVVALVVAAALFGGFLGGFFESQLNSRKLAVVSKNGSSSSASNVAVDIDALVDEVSDRVEAKLVGYNSKETIAQEAMKSVVGITVRSEVINNNPFNPFSFGLKQERTSSGSGVIVDGDGYILTNAHVVVGANNGEVSVLLYDGTEAVGKTLWMDESLDLAIVKVDTESKLTVAKMGNSDALKVGESVIAVGNPLGLNFQRSVTSGIISGLNRTIESQETGTMENLIQTDASINHGNSGGPLINMAGEVIGINTIKIGDGEGLGFSIPINSAKSIVEKVVKNGGFERVTLGVTVVPVDVYEAKLGVDIESDKGLVVIQIQKGSNAYNSGIRVNDILTEFNGVELDLPNDLIKSLYDLSVGDSVNAKIIRDGSEENIKINFQK